MKRYRFLWIGLLIVVLVASAIIISQYYPTAQSPAPTVTTSPTAAPRPTATATVAATATLTPVATSVAASTTAMSSTLKVYFLDVGQGDSILLAGTDFTILVDTGRQDHDEVVPYLREIGIHSLDLLIGTHPHADHIGQFPEVLRAVPVREVWMSGDVSTTKTFEDAIDALAASGAAYHEPRAGETYQIGTARIEVLHPAHLTGEANEGSVSIRLTYDQMRFVLTGDAEARSEGEILDLHQDLSAQILKLGHHGSNTSSSLPFLIAVSPEVAVWSAGVDNSYGHPHPETLDHLNQLGIVTYGTAVSGTVVVLTDGVSYQVQTFATGETLPLAPHRPAPAISSPTCKAGQVNINTAAVEELQRITQIGPARARQLIELRPYRSLDELDRVSGITPTTVERIKEQGVACVE